MSEAVSSVIGFGVMIRLARRLGPQPFADLEYASAVSAWWLVLVRGGCDSIVFREAARHPRLVAPLTEVLLGLRLASALVGLAAVALIASLAGPSRGLTMFIAGSVLVPSALACDVELRASGRFRTLAIVQSFRALILLFGVSCLVAGPGHLDVAAACVVSSEVGSTLALLALHSRRHGLPSFRIRPRACWAVARRGAVAGVTRFGRVTLYAADMLIIGVAAGSASGPYAAARRVAFALLALGLVVPTAMAPLIARAWRAGAGDARSAVENAFRLLICLFLPATVGLAMTSGRWMPLLFGGSFAEGGPWLALIAARVPFVLASNVQQNTLIACRREGWALRLTLGMVGLSGLLMLIGALRSGIAGVAVAALMAEVAGAVAGGFALRRLSVAPPWHHHAGPVLAGCLAMAAMCRAGRGWPLGMVVVAGGSVHLLTWRAFARGASA